VKGQAIFVTQAKVGWLKVVSAVNSRQDCSDTLLLFHTVKGQAIFVTQVNVGWLKKVVSAVNSRQD
jgi:hypothetical protein